MCSLFTDLDCVNDDVQQGSIVCTVESGVNYKKVWCDNEHVSYTIYTALCTFSCGTKRRIKSGHKMLIILYCDQLWMGLNPIHVFYTVYCTFNAVQKDE